MNSSLGLDRLPWLNNVLKIFKQQGWQGTCRRYLFVNLIKAFTSHQDELAGKEGSLETAYLDLSKMSSVRQFAKTMEGRKVCLLRKGCFLLLTHMYRGV